MTNKEIAAAQLLDEYTDLQESLRDLEVANEGLFMQREELVNAAADKLAAFKQAVKDEAITYIANDVFVVTAEQTYKTVVPDPEALAKRVPMLVKAGVISADKKVVYALDKKKLKGALETGIVTQADIDAVTPERAPHAYPVTIKPREV